MQSCNHSFWLEEHHAISICCQPFPWPRMVWWVGNCNRTSVVLSNSDFVLQLKLSSLELLRWSFLGDNFCYTLQEFLEGCKIPGAGCKKSWIRSKTKELSLFLSFQSKYVDYCKPKIHDFKYAKQNLFTTQWFIFGRR